MTDDETRMIADAAGKLIVEGMLLERRSARCWYCDEPGCKCGVKRYDRMKHALEQIVAFNIDNAETPRQNLQWIRELAFAALENQDYDQGPGDVP